MYINIFETLILLRRYVSYIRRYYLHIWNKASVQQFGINFWLNLNGDFGSVSSRITFLVQGENLQVVRVGGNLRRPRVVFAVVYKFFLSRRPSICLMLIQPQIQRNCYTLFWRKFPNLTLCFPSLARDGPFQLKI